MSEENLRAEPSRVPGLDLLRLAAVAGVVLYHYGFWGPASNAFRKSPFHLSPLSRSMDF